MSNERLRTAILQSGKSVTALAAELGVDPKTVQRWVRGRVPYRRTRYQISKFLEVEEAYLWPEETRAGEILGTSQSEILNVYPHRYTVPDEVFSQLFDSAEQDIGILVYSGYFLAENGGLRTMLRQKAHRGVRVRIMVGDPDSEQVRQRSLSEGIGDALVGRIRNVIALLKSVAMEDAVELRLHSTILYNSLYVADEQVMVNPHVYGFGAPDAPVLHLRQVAGGTMVNTYLESFEKVWAEARPVELGE